MLHGYLKIMFTDTDISLDGVEIVKCAARDECEFSIALNAVEDILYWHSDDSTVNSRFFSVNDLFYATV